MEDDPVSRRLAVRLLEKRGHIVDPVRNGKEAIDALGRDKYGVVLMDVQMPEMDGFQATAAIRDKEKSGGDHIPIIAMTAGAMKGDRERCLEAGMDAYLSKPFDRETLLKAVEGVITVPVDSETTASDSYREADEIIDKAEALSRTDGDVALLREIIRLFLNQAPNMLADIRESVDRRDGMALELAAHKLKGALANIAANAATEMVSALEVMGHENDLTHAEEELRALELEIQRLQLTLAAYSEESQRCGS